MSHWTEPCIADVTRGAPVALVTLCTVQGSAPQDAGAKMVVREGSTCGTIGGGNLEFQAIDQARKCIAQGDRRSVLQDYPLGPLLAQCCGGYVRVLIEVLGPDDLVWLEALRPTQDSAQALWTQSTITAQGPRRIILAKRQQPNAQSKKAPYFLDAKEEPLNAARPDLHECAFMVERHAIERPELFLFGAGHVGQAVAHILAVTPFVTTWFDQRDHESIPASQGHGDRLTAPGALQTLGKVDEAVAQASPNAFYVVLTHSHDLDYEIVHAILRRGDFRYCGLIGSQTKRARFVSRLRDDGIGDEPIARLTCPIGAGPLSGKAPAVVAVSLATQLMMLIDQPTGAVRHETAPK